MSLYVQVVNAPFNCPYCDKPMDPNDWQSKDLKDRDNEVMTFCQIYHFNSRTSGEIHEGCSSCHKYVQLEIKDGKMVSFKER